MLKFLYPTIDNAKAIFNLVSTYKDEIWDFLPWIYNIKTVEDERLFLLNTYRKWEYWYWIYDNENLVWYVWLYNIHYDEDWKCCCELWIWTTKKWTWYKAMSEIISEYNYYDKFIAIINVNNNKSISMIERLWFKKEDEIKKYRILNWKYENVYVYTYINNRKK